MKAEKFSSHSAVLECPATYYDAATKKWITGNFFLSRSFVQFISIPVNEDDQFHLHLPLNTVTCLEKRQSNLIYPCLVVCIGSEKHWFGSFASRDAVYNLFELFWRECLISKPYKKISPPKTVKSKSSLGKELLEMLNESKNTLIGTANALSEHSQQLYEAEEAVEDLSNDLTVAEEAVKSLNVPFANILTQKNENTNMSPLHKYKVTFSYSNSDNKMDWEKGVLVISNDIILLKKDDITLMQITKDELDYFQVLSPWELCIVHTFSDLRKSCYFMCPQLSRLLKFISSISHYQQKISYTDDDSSVYDTASCYSSSSCGSTESIPSTSSGLSNLSKKADISSNQSDVKTSTLSKEEVQEINNALESLEILAAKVRREQGNQMERINTLLGKMQKRSAVNTPSSISDSSNSSKKLEPTPDQAQVESSVLSEEELTEINSALQNLQMLASEVAKEQENQVERIDSLAESMEKTEIRMKKVFKKS